MITTKFTGRLGNIIIEIFNTFKLAQDKKIPFNQVFFNRNYNATCCGREKYNKLKHFNNLKNYIDENKLFFSNILNHFIDHALYNKLISQFNQINFDTACKLKQINNIVLIDNPVNLLYFNNNKHESLKLFKLLFKNDLLISKNKNIYFDISNRVAIHVRRTDYTVWNNGKYLLSADHINDTILNHVKNKNNKFIIFSDDIQWCKQNIKIVNNTDIIFHEPQQNDYDDMILMSLCKEIFKNGGHSSFSKCADILRQCYKI